MAEQPLIAMNDAGATEKQQNGTKERNDNSSSDPSSANANVTTNNKVVGKPIAIFMTFSADAKLFDGMEERNGDLPTNPTSTNLMLTTNDEVVDKPTSIFMTFSTNTKLPDGIFSMRSLGNGKYEMINVEALGGHGCLQSDEVISAFETEPKRGQLLGMHIEKSVLINANCQMGLRLSSKLSKTCSSLLTSF
jgi:hypothetical protein